MKIKRLAVFLFACFVVGALLLPPVVTAGAQALATVTRTFIPPSVTPTNYVKTCSIGTPSGWGTYTPSPLWGLECGACVSEFGTSTPTITPPPWLGTGTPPVGCTPAVGGTPAVTGTPANSCYFLPTVTTTPLSVGSISCDMSHTSVGFNCQQINSRTLKYSGMNYVAYPAGNHPLQVSFTSSVVGSFTAYSRLEVLTAPGLTFMYIGSNDNTADTTVTTRMGNSNYIVGNLAILPMTRFYENNPSHADRVNVGIYDGEMIMPSNFWHTYQIVTGSLYTYKSFYFEGSSAGSITISIDPINNISTPSPTGTPYFDTGYCSSVAPPLDDFGFDLFMPDGEVNCSMGWDSFEVGNNVVPAVQICFQPSLFGVIKMFGGEYEIGMLALAAAGAFIWRFMRTV